MAQGSVATTIQDLEIQLRAAAFRDLRLILETTLNDRSLLPDAAPARPCEIIHQQRARDTLESLAGVALDDRKFSRLVAAVVPELLIAQASLPQPQQAEAPILYIETDGTGTPFRRAELTGIKGQQPDGSARTREAKLGCVFTQTITDADGHPVRDPDSTTYVATYAGCREIGTLLRAEAFRRGYAQTPTTIYLGDGAPWIWENARLNFPDAIQILDFYHASEHAGTLATELYGSGEPSRTQQSTWCHQLKATGAHRVISEAKAALAQPRAHWTEEKAAEVAKQIDYFETNASRMEYPKFIAAGYFIGSGVVEAGCKTVIGQRMKQSGMFWGEAGGQAMLTLRCMALSGNLAALWTARLPQLAQARAKAPKWSPSLN